MGGKNASYDHLGQQNSLGQFDEAESGLGDYFTSSVLPTEERKHESLERPSPMPTIEASAKV